MKNLFAFNLNSHEGEGAFSANGAKYITARAEASASKELDASEKNLQSVKKRAAPWWLLLLAELCFVGGIFVLAVFVLPGDDESWAEMYGKFPWAVFAGTGAVVLGIALFALCAIRKKHIADNVEYKNADARVQKALFYVFPPVRRRWTSSQSFIRSGRTERYGRGAETAGFITFLFMFT